jgi:excisionase family DNA binding protein
VNTTAPDVTPDAAEDPTAGADLDDLRAALKDAHADLEKYALSYDQVCDVLQISRYTLSRIVSSGKLEAIQFGPRKYVLRASLAAYIDDLRKSIRPGADVARSA